MMNLSGASNEERALIKSIHHRHASGKCVRIADLIAQFRTDGTLEAVDAVVRIVHSCLDRGVAELLSDEEREGWAAELRDLAEQFSQRAAALERYLAERRSALSKTE
jgi:uncharacterized protein related to proFAR isomerase